MTFNCIICSDILQTTLHIYSTKCGHVFHHVCLIQWLERSKTCPQCRCKTTENTIFRLYFNVPNTEGTAPDVGLLQSKLDSMSLQISIKDKEIAKQKELRSSLEIRNTHLRMEIAELEQKITTLDSVQRALKEQVNYYKRKCKDTQQMSDEVKSLKAKVEELKNVELIMSGTRDQVKEILRLDHNPKSLALYVATLKKELTESDRKTKHQNLLTRTLQTDLSRLRKELADVNAKLKDKQEECAKYKLNVPRKSILEISSNSDCIILDDSPKRISTTMQNENVAKPTSSGTESNGKVVNTPFKLSIKSSNVGLNCLITPRFVTEPPKAPVKVKLSQNTYFADPTMPVPRDLNSDFCYDGLGGHVKDKPFPQPSLKRHQPLKVTNAKMRKLTNQKTSSQ